MSGGHFDYNQHYINDIIISLENYIYGRELSDYEIKEYIENLYWTDKETRKKIERYVKENKSTVPNEYKFSDETINSLKIGLDYLNKAYIYAHRIDWLLSGDDGENTFKEQLNEELKQYEKFKSL